MRRFWLLLANEFKLTRTAMMVNVIAIVQPTLMFLLMSTVIVMPTYDMNVVQPETALEQELVDAMEQVGSPIGSNYIRPLMVETAQVGYRQVVEVVELDGRPTALQHYGYIDSNLVKNFRNRLTASLMRLWNRRLGDGAVSIDEHPWLPRDITFMAYLGMAMIPLAAYLAAAMIGGYLMAQEFESGTILEYRLSPASTGLLLTAKLVRLLLTGLAAGAILLLAMGWLTGLWPDSIAAVFAILSPLTLIAACIGLIAGLLTRSSLPSFLIALATAFAFWLVGSGFGLAAGFSSIYERISRLIPNTPVIEMLFPHFYFGRQVAADPVGAELQLVGYSLALLLGVTVAYRRRVLNMGR